MKSRYYLVFIFSVCLFSCKSTQIVMHDGQEQSFRNVQEYFEKSDLLKSYFAGFQLYDIEEKEVLYSHDAEKYFTPASNTKLLTLYTAMHYLQDSLAWVNVYEYNADKIYQPLGDPSFLHPDLTSEERIRSYFKNLPGENIKFTITNFQDKQFGSGWAWDDFTAYYQTEKSAFPISSNFIRFHQDSIFPAFLKPTIAYNQTDGLFKRDMQDNRFYLKRDNRIRNIPFHVNKEVLNNFFSSQQKQVEWVDSIPESYTLTSTVYSLPVDSVFKVMMQNSDNHIAEQLLLQASQLQLGYMNTSEIIEKAKQDLLAPVANDLNWVDGSGLSRYNLFTPRAMVYVMNQIVEEKGIEWIKEVFAVGGVSGTIKNYYAFDKPRVFAKTGTLRNNHCLTGIIQAKSGKWYTFSFMNNHYPGSSKVAKEEMTNVLTLIVELY